VIADYTLTITDSFVNGACFLVIGFCYGVMAMLVMVDIQRRKGK
jgi:hypothetical protein